MNNGVSLEVYKTILSTVSGFHRSGRISTATKNEIAQLLNEARQSGDLIKLEAHLFNMVGDPQNKWLAQRLLEMLT